MQPDIAPVPKVESEIKLSIETPIEELLKHKEFEEIFMIELRLLMLKLVYPYLDEHGLDQIFKKMVSTEQEAKAITKGRLNRPFFPEGFQEDPELNKRISGISKTYQTFADLDMEGLKKLDNEKYKGALFKRINIRDLISITLEEYYGIMEKEEFEGRS